MEVANATAAIQTQGVASLCDSNGADKRELRLVKRKPQNARKATASTLSVLLAEMRPAIGPNQTRTKSKTTDPNKMAANAVLSILMSGVWRAKVQV
jgi:hypothetical protein